MNLAYPAIFSLILGLTSGEHDKDIKINDLDKDSRKLLYVVGVYPEWEQKIAEFKEKWGKNGEKYLSKNVYIHGDIQESLETKRRMDTDSIKIKRPPLIQLDVPAPVPERRRNTTNLFDYVKKNAGMNTTDTKEAPITSAMAQRRALAYQNFVKDILIPDKPMRKKYVEDTVQRKSNTFENKDDTIQRKYSNINRIYRGGHLRGHLRSMNDSPKEEIKSNEDIGARKLNNVKRIYGRITAKNLDESASNELENKTPNFWVRNLEEGFGEAVPKKLHNMERPFGKVHVRPSQTIPITNPVKPGYFTDPELELKWIKEVFIPRLLEQASRKSALVSEEIHTEPILPKIEEKSFTNKLDDDSDTEESNERKTYNYKLLHSGEQFLKERMLGRKEAANSSKNEDDDDDEEIDSSA